MKLLLAIPTYNGGELWRQSVENIKKFSPHDIYVQVIDSGSKDNTQLIAKTAGFDVKVISSLDFNHGGTRSQAIDIQKEQYDIVIFLTQDAIPEENFVNKIVDVFEDEKVACAYGRQLPHLDANPIAKHARFFNYSDTSHVCEMQDARRMGLKTVFMSNSFSAYRISTFRALGGFPSDTILCEDMFYTAKAVEAGYKVAYVAEAKVRHSHNYTPLEEFKRYFDIGVFHADEPWIRQNFGGAGGEGKKFVISEIKFILRENAFYLPYAFINTFLKLLGYKLGQQYKKLPYKFTKKCSMHKRYWKIK